MALPFRNPVEEDTSDDEQDPKSEWKPPSYAVASEDNKTGEAWKPPSYAEPVDKEPKKGIVAKAEDIAKGVKDRVVKDAKGMKDSLSQSAKFTKEQVDEFVNDTFSKDKESTHPYIKRVIGSQDPSTESALPTYKEMGKKEPDTYGGGFRKGLYDEWVRPLASATGLAGLIGGEEGPIEESTIKPRTGDELPIRQRPREVPALEKTTPQQDKVAIALTKDDVPRTPANISAETGIPKSSIRRTMSEIKKKTSAQPEKPISKADELIKDVEGAKTQPTSQPTTAEEPPVREPIKPKFVNPFEKPSEKASEDLTVGRTADRAIEVIQQANRDGKISDGEALNQIQKAIKDEAGRNIAPSQEVSPTEIPLKAPGTEFQAPPVKAEASGEIPIKRDLLKDKTGVPFNQDVYNKTREKLNMGLDLPSGEGWKPPEYAQAAAEEPKITSEPVKPQEPSLGDKIVTKFQDFEDAAKQRIKDRGTFSGGRALAGLPLDDLADFAVIGASKIAKGAIKFADWSKGMIEDFGDSIKPHLRKIFNAAQAKHGEFEATASKKLLNSMLESKGANVEQEAINKVERANRFAQSASIKEGGMAGAAKSLGKMKGEFAKAEPADAMKLSSDESDMLFSAIKNAKLSEPEKVRARSALFNVMNGDRVPQRNELQILDKVFGKHFGKVSAPGGSTGYDLAASSGEGSVEGETEGFESAGEKLRKNKPDDFLAKLANFSAKTTRSVLGFHIPGTALSFHGFNEAIRNTMFGPDLNPVKAAGRFADAMHYLARPGKAQEFLNANMGELGKAVEEGGLRAETGDIGIAPMFKGNNIASKGFNYLTSPKPLFGQVIPALKLKGYKGLLEQYEKSGMPHLDAAKAAGEATNNIFGGLNLKELERNPTTQKLFRAATLAPDWLESNVRLGKGMFNAIKDPMNPKSKVYLAGMTNFLGSYVALNVLNAINNNGKFSFQNDTGHEFDVAIGKDAMGRTRYFSPYGTAMDMFRIPLEIGHAAVEGNIGKAFSDMRSRASEPLQFMTDLMTNTDYGGRALYDKTKFGKPISRTEQGENILGDAAGHFLPIGAESAINASQGKISPEQFAAQVLQAPMKYKMPDRDPTKLGIRRMKLR